MQAANDVLDRFVEDVFNAPRGRMMRAPWSYAALNDHGQGCAATMIRAGAIGAGRKASGKIVLYISRGGVGNPLQRMLNGWAMYLLALAFMALLFVCWRDGSMLASIAGAIVALFGVGYFGTHGLHAARYWELSISGLGRPGELTRIGAACFAAIVGAACVAGFVSRIF